MDALRPDLRHAGRQLVRGPGFAAAAARVDPLVALRTEQETTWMP